MTWKTPFDIESTGDSTFTGEVNLPSTTNYDGNLLSDTFASKGDITTNGAWTSYTPTIYGGSSALGNGTLTTAWVQVGDIVFHRGILILGSTTVIDSGFGLGVPVAPTVTSSDPAGTVRYLETGVATFAGNATWGSSGATVIWRPMRFIVGTDGKDAAISSSTPFTWGTGDQIRFAFFYEAA